MQAQRPHRHTGTQAHRHTLGLLQAAHELVYTDHCAGNLWIAPKLSESPSSNHMQNVAGNRDVQTAVVPASKPALTPAIRRA